MADRIVLHGDEIDGIALTIRRDAPQILEHSRILRKICAVADARAERRLPSPEIKDVAKRILNAFAEGATAHEIFALIKHPWATKHRISTVIRDAANDLLHENTHLAREDEIYTWKDGTVSIFAKSIRRHRSSLKSSLAEGWLPKFFTI